MNDAYLLTTTDNPYDPLTQFDKWFSFDTEMGYNSSSYLARVAHVSDSLSDPENDAIISDAIDDIIKHNPLGLYKKIRVDKSKL